MWPACGADRSMMRIWVQVERAERVLDTALRRDEEIAKAREVLQVAQVIGLISQHALLQLLLCCMAARTSPRVLTGCGG